MQSPMSTPESFRSPVSAATSSRRAASLALAVDALWATASLAQRDGDHARAEGIFATLVKVSPRDAEAWFAKAIAAGWAAEPGKPRFDEVVVGVGIAVEHAPPGARRELRRRAARALALLAEVSFDELPADLGPEARLDQGRACLRLLDSAIELDSSHVAATRAVLHIADELLGEARSRSAPRDVVAALERTRSSATRYLTKRGDHVAPLHGSNRPAPSPATTSRGLT
jgi:hypothetical protein